jgi:hypothetical protein
MPTITQDVTLKHQSQKDGEISEVTLATGDPVNVIKEWAGHYLVRTTDGKLLNVRKEFVDSSS